MLAAEHYPYTCGALPKRELLDVQRSKISLHRAKADYNYPTILLPHTFSKLAGLRTHIFQTVHEGALAFLVVVSSSCKSEQRSANKPENAKLSLNSLRPDMAEFAGSNPTESIVLFTIGCGN